MNVSMLKGTNGKISTMRVSTMIIVLSVIGIFIAHNIVSMIHGGGFISIGTSEAILLGAALGMKSIQRFAEEKALGGENDGTSMYTPRVPDDMKDN